MKNINLDNLDCSKDCLVTSSEAMRGINGGCTIKIGCNTSGYFVKSYSSSCSNKSLHTQLALYVAKNKVKRPGSYKVTGSTYGTVTYLG